MAFPQLTDIRSEKELTDPDAGAVAAFEQAVALIPAQSGGGAGWVHNRVQSLLDRFELTGSKDDLEEELAMSRRAVDLTSTDQQARATFLESLAQALGAL